MKIEANTPCYLSTLGNNNFWYPCGNTLTYITETIEKPNFKSWVCGNKNLKAILLTTDKLKDVYGNPEAQIVVWVHKNNLKSG